MVFAEINNKMTSIAYATSHTLDMSMNTVDSSTKDNGNGMWTNNEAGLMSWTMQTDNLVSDTSENGISTDDLMTVYLQRKKVKVAFALQKDITDYEAKIGEEFNVPKGGWTPGENYYSGEALITSLNVTASNDGNATMSATFTGCGNILKTGTGLQNAAAAAALANSQGTPVATVAAAKK